MPQSLGGDKVPGIELSRELIAPGTYKVTSFDYEKLLQGASWLTPFGAAKNTMDLFNPPTTPTPPTTPQPEKEAAKEEEAKRGDAEMKQALDNLTKAVTHNTNGTLLLNSTLSNAQGLAALKGNSDLSTWV